MTVLTLNLVVKCLVFRRHLICWYGNKLDCNGLIYCTRQQTIRNPAWDKGRTHSQEDALFIFSLALCIFISISPQYIYGQVVWKYVFQFGLKCKIFHLKVLPVTFICKVLHYCGWIFVPYTCSCYIVHLTPFWIALVYFCIAAALFVFCCPVTCQSHHSNFLASVKPSWQWTCF